METFDCIRYAIGHFEMVTESTIDRESRGCKLQTNAVSGPGVLKKEILTFKEAAKASLHEPLVNFDLAHSLKIGAEDGEWRVVSALL